jgi:hypothetical protein
MRQTFGPVQAVVPDDSALERTFFLKAIELSVNRWGCARGRLGFLPHDAAPPRRAWERTPALPGPDEYARYAPTPFHALRQAASQPILLQLFQDPSSARRGRTKQDRNRYFHAPFPGFMSFTFPALVQLYAYLEEKAALRFACFCAVIHPHKAIGFYMDIELDGIPALQKLFRMSRTGSASTPASDQGRGGAANRAVPHSPTGDAALSEPCSCQWDFNVDEDAIRSELSALEAATPPPGAGEPQQTDHRERQKHLQKQIAQVRRLVELARGGSANAPTAQRVLFLLSAESWDKAASEVKWRAAQEELAALLVVAVVEAFAPLQLQQLQAAVSNAPEIFGHGQLGPTSCSGSTADMEMECPSPGPAAQAAGSPASPPSSSRAAVGRPSEGVALTASTAAKLSLHLHFRSGAANLNGLHALVKCVQCLDAKYEALYMLVDWGIYTSCRAFRVWGSSKPHKAALEYLPLQRRVPGWAGVEAQGLSAAERREFLLYASMPNFYVDAVLTAPPGSEVEERLRARPDPYVKHYPRVPDGRETGTAGTVRPASKRPRTAQFSGRNAAAAADATCFESPRAPTAEACETLLAILRGGSTNWPLGLPVPEVGSWRSPAASLSFFKATYEHVASFFPKAVLVAGGKDCACPMLMLRNRDRSGAAAALAGPGPAAERHKSNHPYLIITPTSIRAFCHDTECQEALQTHRDSWAKRLVLTTPPAIAKILFGVDAAPTLAPEPRPPPAAQPAAAQGPASPAVTVPPGLGALRPFQVAAAPQPAAASFNLPPPAAAAGPAAVLTESPHHLALHAPFLGGPALDEVLDGVFDANAHIALRSELGTGKTDLLLRQIARLFRRAGRGERCRILWICTRISYAEALCTRVNAYMAEHQVCPRPPGDPRGGSGCLRATLYREAEHVAAAASTDLPPNEMLIQKCFHLQKADLLIISLESIHKLVGPFGPGLSAAAFGTYDLAVLDEVEDIQKQLLSTTMKARCRSNHKIFCALLSTAARVWLADGDLGMGSGLVFAEDHMHCLDEKDLASDDADLSDAAGASMLPTAVSGLALSDVTLRALAFALETVAGTHVARVRRPVVDDRDVDGAPWQTERVAPGAAMEVDGAAPQAEARAQPPAAASGDPARRSRFFWIQNEAKTLRRKVFWHRSAAGRRADWVAYQQKLLEALWQRRKVAVACNTKATVKELYDFIRKAMELNERALGSLRVQLLTADTPPNVKDALLRDPASWSQFDVFLYSPVVGSGVSFDKEHFDMLFVYATNASTTPREVFQQAHRIRRLRMGEIHVFVEQSAGDAPGHKVLAPQATSPEDVRMALQANRSRKGWSAAATAAVPEPDFRWADAERRQLRCEYTYKTERRSLTEQLLQRHLEAGPAAAAGGDGGGAAAPGPLERFRGGVSAAYLGVFLRNHCDLAVSYRNFERLLVERFRAAGAEVVHGDLSSSCLVCEKPAVAAVDAALGSGVPRPSHVVDAGTSSDVQLDEVPPSPVPGVQLHASTSSTTMHLDAYADRAYEDADLANTSRPADADVPAVAPSAASLAHADADLAVGQDHGLRSRAVGLVLAPSASGDVVAPGGGRSEARPDAGPAGANVLRLRPVERDPSSPAAPAAAAKSVEEIVALLLNPRAIAERTSCSRQAAADALASARDVVDPGELEALTKRIAWGTADAADVRAREKHELRCHYRVPPSVRLLPAFAAKFGTPRAKTAFCRLLAITRGWPIREAWLSAAYAAEADARAGSWAPNASPASAPGVPAVDSEAAGSDSVHVSLQQPWAQRWTLLPPTAYACTLEAEQRRQDSLRDLLTLFGIDPANLLSDCVAERTSVPQSELVAKLDALEAEPDGAAKLRTLREDIRIILQGAKPSGTRKSKRKRGQPRPAGTRRRRASDSGSSSAGSADDMEQSSPGAESGPPPPTTAAGAVAANVDTAPADVAPVSPSDALAEELVCALRTTLRAACELGLQATQTVKRAGGSRKYIVTGGEKWRWILRQSWSDSDATDFVIADAAVGALAIGSDSESRSDARPDSTDAKDVAMGSQSDSDGAAAAAEDFPDRDADVGAAIPADVDVRLGVEHIQLDVDPDDDAAPVDSYAEIECEYAARHEADQPAAVAEDRVTVDLVGSDDESMY